MKKDNLGDRMKENYENRAKTQLLRRTPVIIRLDEVDSWFIDTEIPIFKGEDRDYIEKLI